MNWKQLLWNALGMFAGGYTTAAAAGTPQKVAVAAGTGAVIANVAGLFQQQPHK